jgi:hypothetical protein
LRTLTKSLLPQISHLSVKSHSGIAPDPSFQPRVGSPVSRGQAGSTMSTEAVTVQDAPATWLEAPRSSGGDAESEWKAMPSSEQRAIKTVTDASAKNQDNVSTNWKPRLPMAQPSRCRKQWQRAQQQSLHALLVIELLAPSAHRLGRRGSSIRRICGQSWSCLSRSQLSMQPRASQSWACHAGLIT